ncbi:MAG TPA: sulfatase-like hydrolase/transferase [Burkholderiales bacterium]|jgi:phosphoglycerol transferase MdoB-like AlkP superfamily enzyme
MRPLARYVTLLWVAAAFLAINGAVRLSLLGVEADAANFAPLRLAAILGLGSLYDAAAASYLLIPFALLALVCPSGRHGRLAHALLAAALACAAVVGMLFTATSELVFWNEFSSRFNFIAVDYLVYTREVVGNLRQSYPLGAMLGAIALASLVLCWTLRKRFWRAAAAEVGGFSRRLAASGAVLALPLLASLAVGEGPREALATPSARELAGNGYYELVRAFRDNDLDYRAFYRMVPLPQAEAEVLAEFAEADSHARFTRAHHPLEREVTAAGPARSLHVVLVSIESLGADYMESLGGRKGLTPNLDRFSARGLAFTRIYATGLRTVRGLEALSLSIPPTPGHAVPMRPRNKGLQTLGEVLRERGYEPLYIYGGYSYFDNMRDFFEGNGYTVIDRRAIDAQTISHETIWGVADEDLFRHALREMDARAAAGKRVFAHIMTTSNHRPFTYPEGRIDIPSGSGRDGAVKYTDWAIGRFVEEASRRPWFRQTLFVFVADHTSRGRGRTDLPPENYHIPLIVYAPGVVAPGRIDWVASQIDVAPTVLALLNISYTSRFFGQDILTEGRKHQRAFMANYLTVGYMEDGMVVELSPKRRVRVVEADSGRPVPTSDAHARHLVDEAVGYYELAAEVVADGVAEPSQAPPRP